MADFPQTPAFTGLNKPARFEADVRDLEVEGEIPAHLDGAFYRVQPDPQFPPRLGDDIAFNGDGLTDLLLFDALERPHDWLNTSLFLCTGERWADGIRLWTWRVT